MLYSLKSTPKEYGVWIRNVTIVFHVSVLSLKKTTEDACMEFVLQLPDG
jgi:hypothetical protein